MAAIQEAAYRALSEQEMHQRVQQHRNELHRLYGMYDTHSITIQAFTGQLANMGFAVSPQLESSLRNGTATFASTIRHLAAPRSEPHNQHSAPAGTQVVHNPDALQTSSLQSSYAPGAPLAHQQNSYRMRNGSQLSDWVGGAYGSSIPNLPVEATRSLLPTRPDSAVPQQHRYPNSADIRAGTLSSMSYGSQASSSLFGSSSSPAVTAQSQVQQASVGHADLADAVHRYYTGVITSSQLIVALSEAGLTPSEDLSRALSLHDRTKSLSYREVMRVVHALQPIQRIYPASGPNNNSDPSAYSSSSATSSSLRPAPPAYLVTAACRNPVNWVPPPESYVRQAMTSLQSPKKPFKAPHAQSTHMSSTSSSSSSPSSSGAPPTSTLQVILQHTSYQDGGNVLPKAPFVPPEHHRIFDAPIQRIIPTIASPAGHGSDVSSSQRPYSSSSSYHSHPHPSSSYSSASPLYSPSSVYPPLPADSAAYHPSSDVVVSSSFAYAQAQAHRRGHGRAEDSEQYGYANNRNTNTSNNSVCNQTSSAPSAGPNAPFNYATPSTFFCEPDPFDRQDLPSHRPSRYMPSKLHTYNPCPYATSSSTIAGCGPSEGEYAYMQQQQQQQLQQQQHRRPGSAGVGPAHAGGNPLTHEGYGDDKARGKRMQEEAFRTQFGGSIAAQGVLGARAAYPR